MGLRRMLGFKRGEVSTEKVPARDNFVDIAYRGILGRTADRGAIEKWTPRLEAEPGWHLLKTLIASPEFHRNYLHQLATKGGMPAVAAACNRLALSLVPAPLHEKRKELVKNHLPVVRSVLDLGGASSEEEGGLIATGYRGADEITIIDIPPDRRFKGAAEKKTVSIHHGTTVRYAYHSLAELEQYPDDHFDFVWSGQTIEHVSLTDGDKVMKQVPRILKRGGIFALDTPNRTVTQLAVGEDAFIHAEHAYEYRFEEFIARHKHCGLEQVTAKGIMDMVSSLTAGYLLPHEIMACDINLRPQSSYVFFLAYRKP